MYKSPCLWQSCPYETNTKLFYLRPDRLVHGDPVYVRGRNPKKRFNAALLRGAIYSVGIFTGEYVSGSFLKKHKMCPWDYSRAKSNVNGVIRLDFAPLWMFAGLTFEKVMELAGGED